jgi:hypothetical protein
VWAIPTRHFFSGDRKMRKYVGLLFGMFMAVTAFGQRAPVTSPAVSALTSTPAITIGAGTADSADFPTTGMHQLDVELDLGTVTGSYTTCTMQAKTLLNGTYYTIGSAASVTIASNTHPMWLVQAPLATTVSTSSANDFGGRTKFTFACSGAYGTSIAAPVITVLASPAVPGGSGGGGSNAAAGLTGNAVPSSAGYTAANVGGNLTGLTATNNGGKISIDANITGGSTGNGAASNTGAAVPVQADYVGGNLAGNLVGIAAYTDAGSSGLGVHVANTVVENMAQVNGTTADTNSGTKSAGTLRVVIATDQPQLTNKLLVTPDLPTGASTSALQTTGNTSLSNIDTSTSAIGAKTDAKNAATDTTSVSVVALLKELSSLAQVLGQTTMSASTAVAIASDQSAVPVKGAAAIGAAAGAPVTVGALSAGTSNVVAYVADPCQTSQVLTVSGSITASTQVITGTAAKIVTICGEPYIFVNGTATNWAMVEGTGSVCATNTAKNFGGGTTAAAGPNFVANQGQILGSNFAAYISTVAGDNICLLLSAANQVNYNIRYVVQ